MDVAGGTAWGPAALGNKAARNILVRHSQFGFLEEPIPQFVSARPEEARNLSTLPTQRAK
jgi:hypothetical protein